MKRPIILLTLAILLPSVVLGWLAIRSLNNQQAASGLRELQLQQERARRLAGAYSDAIEQQRDAFNRAVDRVLQENATSSLGDDFTSALQHEWPPVRVGFIVSLDKHLISPAVRSGEEARDFRLQNEQFLTNREPLEVYRFSRKLYAVGSGAGGGGTFAGPFNPSTQLENRQPFPAGGPASERPAQTDQPAQFQQLIGDAPDGAYSRFLADELQLFFWTRNARHPDLIFGAQVDLTVCKKLLGLPAQPANEGVCLAVLDEKNLPVFQTIPGFDCRSAVVFAEAPIGVLLPYWRAAVYLTDPDRIAHSARSTRWLVLGTVVLLVAAIAIGTFLIILSVQRELTLARQQTDFVSSVSHELKTPLTSIRIFAELLENDPGDPEKRARYLGIIRTETARLSRMINNVLDFTRHSQTGQPVPVREVLDLREVTRDTLENLRPQLEADGFQLEVDLPLEKVEILADREALTQILNNLISNAEKYSRGIRKISVSVSLEREILVQDRGIGIARGEEQAVFEKFYRASNAASTGAGGAGLGLTIARTLAEALGGTLTHAPREGGGTTFCLCLPPATVLASLSS